jgi:diaminopimelate epimerase
MLRLLPGPDNKRCGSFPDMAVGLPREEERYATLDLAGRSWQATILNVGNPQCAIFVDEVPNDWLVIAREAEGHSRFPKRTNVSVVKPVASHIVEALFFERGAGETRSSGTGSTGAAVAAILRGKAESPVEIRTPAGTLNLRWDDSVYLTGPAELVGEGNYFVDF